MRCSVVSYRTVASRVPHRRRDKFRTLEDPSPFRANEQRKRPRLTSLHSRPYLTERPFLIRPGFGPGLFDPGGSCCDPSHSGPKRTRPKFSNPEWVHSGFVWQRGIKTHARSKPCRGWARRPLESCFAPLCPTSSSAIPVCHSIPILFVFFHLRGLTRGSRVAQCPSFSSSHGRQRSKSFLTGVDCSPLLLSPLSKP